MQLTQLLVDSYLKAADLKSRGLGNQIAETRSGSSMAITVLGEFAGALEVMEAMRDSMYGSARIDAREEIISLLGCDGTIHYESGMIYQLLGYHPTERIGGSAFD